MAYNWVEPLMYHHTDAVDYWRVCIDEIVAVTWRPYMGLGPWVEEGTQFPFTISPCFVFGRWAYVAEQYRPDRVLRQFGW